MPAEYFPQLGNKARAEKRWLKGMHIKKEDGGVKFWGYPWLSLYRGCEVPGMNTLATNEVEDRWHPDGGQMDAQTNQRVTYRTYLGIDGSLKGFTKSISSIDIRYIKEIRTSLADKIKGIDEAKVSMRHVSSSPREEVWSKE